MKLIHLITKHRKQSFVLISVIVCFLVSLALYFLKLPMWLITIIDVLLIIAICLLVTNCYLLLFKKPTDELNNNCDPYPVLELTEKLLTYEASKEVRLSYLILYVSALSSVGERQKAIDVLHSMNIHEIPIQLYRAIYYHDLIAMNFGLGNFDEVRRYYPDLMNCLSEIKNEKQKPSLTNNILFAEIIKSFCDKEYGRTLQLLNDYKSENKREELTIAMYYAKTYLALNETEKAREKLEFIIENGNKLYCVTEAREMLNDLEL